MIKKKTKTPFTLALDTGKKQTGRYSSGRGEFTGYVINSKGKVVKIIKGDLRKRAKADELLAAIAAGGESSNTNSGSGSKPSGPKTSGSGKR